MAPAAPADRHRTNGRRTGRIRAPQVSLPLDGSIQAHSREPGVTQLGQGNGGSAFDFDHLEIVLGDAAVRAGPGIGNVFPARAGVDAFFRQAGFLVDRKSTRLNSSHPSISYAVFCL